MKITDAEIRAYYSGESLASKLANSFVEYSLRFRM